MNPEAPHSAAFHDPHVKRHAFFLKLKPGTEKGYDEVHGLVPRELIALLKRNGISEYSIFRRGQLLFLVLKVRDFDRAWQNIELDPAYKAWQKVMEPFFEEVSNLRPGERFPMMDEVFYLP